VGNGNGIIKNGGGGGGGMGNNRTTPPAVANGKPHLFAVKNMTLSRRPCLYARESVRGGVAASGAFRKISGVPPPPLPQPRDAVSGTARVRVQTVKIIILFE
jgi:hypothetical protein